jgi:transcriptional regulator with XRE-family HTH domain
MTGLSLREAGRRAGVSAPQLGRLERGAIAKPSLDIVCRAARAVGLAASVKLYPAGPPVRDRAQVALLARFEAALGPPIRMQREVPLPIAGDLRAWDARITDGSRTASVEGESVVGDAQALERRIALKERDDPGSGVVILVVNRTAHNRRAVGACREALRDRFPLDGPAILSSLRAGRVPPLGGIVYL